VTYAYESPTVTPGASGFAGTPAGVTGLELADGAEAPRALVAVRVNAYGVPFVNPSTVQARAPEVEQVLPSGTLVTVYPMTGPTLLALGDQETFAWPSSASAAGAAGMGGGAGAPIVKSAVEKSRWWKFGPAASDGESSETLPSRSNVLDDPSAAMSVMLVSRIVVRSTYAGI
jgi:hypothetical protein